MSIKKSQAILKHFIDLKFSVWFTLCSENETMHVSWHLELFAASSFLFPLSAFRFPLSFFLFPFSSFLFPLSPLTTYLRKIEATLLAGL